MRALAAALALAALVAGLWPGPARAQGCQSAEQCLANGLERDWRQYRGVIEESWAAKKRIAAQLAKAQALARPDLLERIQAEQARVEERWRFAQALAGALTAPHFKEFLTRRHSDAATTRAAAAARLHKETDLYKRLVAGTLGPQRQGVIADIAGYEREAVHLRDMFCRDGMLASASWLKENAGAMARSWEKIAETLASHGLAQGAGIAGSLPYVQTMGQMSAVGYAGFEAVHAGTSVQEETQRNHDFRALAEATRGAAAASLRMVELVVEAPDNPAKRAAFREAFGAVGARAVTYANVMALGLDTALTVAAVGRLRDAEARQVQVETDDAAWRTRVEAAGRIARGAAAREARARQQLDRQRDIESLLEQIHREGGP